MGIDLGLITEIVEISTEGIIDNDINSDEEALSVIEKSTMRYKESLSISEMIYVIDRIYGKLRGQLGPISYLLDLSLIHI